MGGGRESALAPFISTHLTKGVPISELGCSERDKKRISALVRTFNAYNQNPFMSVRKWLTQRENRYISAEFLPTALELFEFMRTTFSERNSRQRAFDQASYLAESAAKQALATGDAQMKLKASQQITKLHGLDKPAPAEDVSKNTANLPWFLVRTPKAISEDAEEYTDFELEQKMRELGATIDPHFIEVNRRVQEMERKSEEKTSAVDVHPDYITDDLFDEYD